MRTGKKAMLLIVGMMALAMVLLQTGCKDEEAERQKAEAERQAEQARKDAAQAQAAATWNQMEIEKAKALQAQRDIEQAKAKQAEENRINSDEWRATIWKIGKWVLGILALGVVLFFAPIIWEETLEPVIARRQELKDRARNAQLYAAEERTKTEAAKAEAARAERVREDRLAKEAEAVRVADLKRIEELKAQQLAEPRLLQEAKAKQVEEERKKKEAEAVIARRAIEEAKAKQAEEERKAIENQAKLRDTDAEGKAQLARIALGEAQKMEEERKLKEIEAVTREAEARKAEEVRRAEEAEAKIMEEERKAEEAKLAAVEIERQIKMKEYPLGAHIEIFCQQVETLNGWIANGEEENRVFDLYLKLQAALEAASKIPLKERERIAEQHKELNQVETLMNLYSEKIRRVRDDEDLDDEEREEKIAYWRDLRNRQVAAIQGE